MPHTFESLSRMNKVQLESVLTSGDVPPVGDDLLGWEFQGWNLNPLAALIASRKFKKGFFGGARVGGYNMTVRQNRFDEPWIPTPRPEDPKRHSFFVAVPGAEARAPRYARSLVLDYGLWGGYSPLNPVGYLVDYVVYPNPGDKTLLLGKAYVEAGIQLFQGFFVLRRDDRPSGYTPPAAAR
jgi:hypothetical protein